MFTDQVFKQKIIHSFDLAKRDIYALYQHISYLTSRMKEIETENRVLRYSLEQVKGEMIETRLNLLKMT